MNTIGVIDMDVQRSKMKWIRRKYSCRTGWEAGDFVIRHWNGRWRIERYLDNGPDWAALPDPIPNISDFETLNSAKKYVRVHEEFLRAVKTR